MSSSERTTRFRLIDSKSSKPRRTDIVFEEYDAQGSLFPKRKSTLMIFLEFSKIEDDYFTSLVQELGPRIIIDVRAVPRFDLGALNRRSAFALFKEVNAKYIETAQLFTPEDIHKTNRSVSTFSRNVRELLIDGCVRGPILVLMTGIVEDGVNIRFLPKMLPSDVPWSVYTLP